MKRNFLLLFFTVLLMAGMAGPAAAAYSTGSMEHFQAVRRYDGQFSDVPEGVWFAESVAKVYAYGLVDGVSYNNFAPYGNLTVAECIALACRLNGIYRTGYFDLARAPGGLWYLPYFNYAEQQGIIDAAPLDYGNAITRGRFASIFARALPASELPSINEVADQAIPDLFQDNPAYADIYRLYRAGILAGQDALGSAAPEANITRAEAAAILLRMADPDARKRFSLSGSVVLYAPDGGSVQVSLAEVGAYEAMGYQHTLFCTVRRIGGDERVVTLEQAAELRKSGWYAGGWKSLPSSIAAMGHSSNIPVICLETGGAEVVQREYYVPCTVNVFNVPEELGISAAGGVRVRGNSSAYYGDLEQIRNNSVPYRIKFDSKQNLLGLNDGAKAKSWVLLYGVEGTVDAVKNDAAFRLGRALLEPDGTYCSDGQLVHVYLNGIFQGSYLLCEQNQVHPSRVNVQEPDLGNTSTNVGYFVELDNYAEEPYFWMDYGNTSAADVHGVVRPFRGSAYSVKSDTYGQSQLDFICNYMRNAFKLVYEACENGVYLTFDEAYRLVPASFRSTQETVEAALDVQSFVDMYILYELLCDYDVGGGSFFFCVDFSKNSLFPKLTLTAPWDFNWICMGEPTDPIFAGAFRYDSFVQTLGDRSNPWFILLYKQPWFQQEVMKKWASIGGGVAIDRMVSEELGVLEQFQRDLERGDPGLVRRSQGYLSFISRRGYWLDGLWS